MGIGIPTKPLKESPEKPPNSFDPFHPDMPRIPGVGDLRVPAAGKSAGSSVDRAKLARIGGAAAAALLLSVAILWWLKSAPRGVAELPLDQPPNPASVETQPPSPAAALPVVPPTARGSVQVATTEELARPWSAKKFIYVNALTSESIDAMVVRLPGGGLWAFALQEPYGRCELEYVTDLSRLANQYRYTASHPMVANPCNSTIYDPSKIGSIGGNVWVRGEIVQGGGLRPPISIDVKTDGHNIVANRIE